MQKQLVALTFMWTAQVAPVAAALLAQASFVQEQGEGELDVEGAADGILQTGPAFLARETPDAESDSEPRESLKHVVVVKAFASGAELFRMNGSRQQKVKVKDIAAHCEKFLLVSPFDKVKVVRDGEAQALQPDAEVEPEVGQKEVWLGCYAQQSSLSKLILVAADKLTAPDTWSARAKDFAQQLAKSTTSLSDTYTDPFAKDFIQAAEWLFDEMASTQRAPRHEIFLANKRERIAVFDESEPVPVRVASGLQSLVRQVEDAAFSELEKQEKEKETLKVRDSLPQLIQGGDTERRLWRYDGDANFAMTMFTRCMNTMRFLSQKYYEKTKLDMDMTALQYRAYESDDAPDSKYVYARDVKYVSRAVHFAPTPVLDALVASGKPVPLEARVTLEFNYDAGTQPFTTARPGRLRAIIVRGHWRGIKREDLRRMGNGDPGLGNEDPGLGRWNADMLGANSASGTWAIVPFATGSEFTVLENYGRTHKTVLLPPPVNFMDIGEWVEKNKARLPVLGA